jgi:hypothetical protein
MASARLCYHTHNCTCSMFPCVFLHFISIFHFQRPRCLFASEVKSGAVEEKTSFVPSSQHKLSLDDILTFCFPPSVDHALSTGRLYVLAEAGPLHKGHQFDTCLCTNCKNECINRRKTDGNRSSFSCGLTVHCAI